MTTVTADSRRSAVEVDERLRVWRVRWRYAPDAISRAHAQTAIDQWLDRMLELELTAFVIPEQDSPSELLAPAPV